MPPPPPLQVGHQALGSKSPDIGRKMRRNLSKDLFLFFFLVFALRLILGEKWDEIWVKTFFFALHVILGEKWDEIWVKTFFGFFFLVFALHLWFWAKNGTKFEWRPFFLLFTWFWAKNGTKFEWRPFFFALHLFWGKKWDEIWVWQFQILIYVFLKFSEVSAPPPFQYPAYATVYQYVINLSFVMLVLLYCI